MAKNFQVKYYDSDQEYRLLPNNSIEKEYLDKVDYDYKRPYFVGNFGWLTPSKKLADGYLFNLTDYDKNYVKDVKLKANEKIFRYFNQRTAISGASIIIKLNLDKGLIYFLSEEGSEKDEPIFERKGYPALWINIVKDKFAKGGTLSAEEKNRYEELSEKVKESMSGKVRLTSKELVEYGKLKHKKNMAESPLFRKQMEHEAKIEKSGEFGKGGKFANGGKVGKYSVLRELYDLRNDGVKNVYLNGFKESIGYVIQLKLDDSEIKKVDEISYITLYAKGGNLNYKGHPISKEHPSGYYSFYSDKQKRFIKADNLQSLKSIIDKESKMAKGGKTSEQNYKGYSIFLMLELAKNYEFINKNEAYDIQWEDAIRLYESFKKSKFNNVNKSEYDAIDDFLQYQHSDFINGNKQFGKGGSILSSNYSIGGL